ncbi:MFS transporter [Pseudomonas sp. RIT-PI-S]|uniref:MFS transporter n=1 Tax=Pseudomonas sp. RIT-PI-S TaxID=3035295 RepID=UPI0021D88B36|nr:MFS transporter [Pseudomonas sp. RIT-PI-S]
MLDGFDTQSIAFVAPAITQAWGIEPALFGPVFGAGLLGGLLGGVAFGHMGDRFGRKPLLIVAIVIFSMASLLTPWVGSMKWLIAARFITGVGLGGALPGFIALASEYSPARLRPGTVAVMFCGFPLGAVMGGIVSAKLIPAYGWQAVFLLGGALPLVLLPVFVAKLPESLQFLAVRERSAVILRILARMGSPYTWDATAEPMRHKQATLSFIKLFAPGTALGTLLLWVTLFLSLLLSYFLINWIPIVVNRNGLSVQSAVHAVTMLNLGGIVGCLLFGRLIVRFGAARVISIAFACGAAAVASIGLAGGSSLLLCTVTFFAGLFSLGPQMCTVALCSAFYQTFLRATGVGCALGVGRMGAITGPLVGGLLLAAGVSFLNLFLFAGAICAGAAISVGLLGVLVLNRRPINEPPEHKAAVVISNGMTR